VTIVPYGHLFVVAGVVFALGLACVLGRRNLIMTLIGVEVMMNGAAVAFLGGALRWQRLEGQAFVLFIIAVAAVEVSVGLILTIRAYRRIGSIDPDAYHVLKW
jgi:NADH-quinone oxidoreductase subunit K